MAVSMIGPKFYALDDNGKPLSGGKVYTYQAGTNIPKTTFTSENADAANTNPVILNAAGYAPIHLDGVYKIVLTDANDVVVWTADPVSSALNKKEALEIVKGAVLTVDSIKSMPTSELVDGQQISVSGFYPGSSSGGGLFIYKAGLSKSLHNGGTIIDPAAIENWSGDFAGINGFINWSGAGVGCYVRQGLAPYLRMQFFPEMFGAPDTNPTFTDETAIHQKMWDVATSLNGDGAEIQLFRLYPVNGLRTDGVGRRGVRIFAASGVDYKRGLFVKGYCPVQNNQECILKFGGDEINGDSEASYMEGVTIYGRDFNFTKGMVWASRLSQGSFRYCAFRRARAPALYLQKLEDWDFYNCNFGSLCGNDGRGAIVFGEPPMLGGVLASVGNNAIRFNQGRIEFIDGPMISTEGAQAWASTVTFIGTKFESGPTLAAEGDPLGAPSPAYGAHAKDYYIFNLMEGNPLRITVRLVAGCSFSGISVDRCAGIIKAYQADEWSCTDALISGTGSQVVNLFNLQGPAGQPAEMKNFIFKHNSARVFGAQMHPGLDYVFTNKNRLAIDFEYPIAGDADTNKAYRTVGKSMWFMSECMTNTSHFSLVPNPNNETDPCTSPARTVLTNNGVNPNVWFRLNAIGVDGQQKGWMPTNERVSVNIRAKIVGESNYSNGFRVSLRDDVGELATIGINSTTMQWHRAFANIPAGRTNNLRFVSSADNETVKVYIDAVEIVPTIERHIDYEGTASIPDIAPNSVYAFTINQTGIEPGYFYLLSFENASDLLNARVTSYIPFGSHLRVQIENLNNINQINAFTMNWKIRRFL